MNPVNDRRGSESPLAQRQTPIAPIDQQAPVPHARSELETIMSLLIERRSRIRTISVGHACADAKRLQAELVEVIEDSEQASAAS